MITRERSQSRGDYTQSMCLNGKRTLCLGVTAPGHELSSGRGWALLDEVMQFLGEAATDVNFARHGAPERLLDLAIW